MQWDLGKAWSASGDAAESETKEKESSILALGRQAVDCLCAALAFSGVD